MTRRNDEGRRWRSRPVLTALKNSTLLLGGLLWAALILWPVQTALAQAPQALGASGGAGGGGGGGAGALLAQGGGGGEAGDPGTPGLSGSGSNLGTAPAPGPGGGGGQNLTGGANGQNGEGASGSYGLGGATTGADGSAGTDGAAGGAAGSATFNPAGGALPYLNVQAGAGGSGGGGGASGAGTGGGGGGNGGNGGAGQDYDAIEVFASNVARGAIDGPVTVKAGAGGHGGEGGYTNGSNSGGTGGQGGAGGSVTINFNAAETRFNGKGIFAAGQGGDQGFANSGSGGGGGAGGAMTVNVHDVLFLNSLDLLAGDGGAGHNGGGAAAGAGGDLSFSLNSDFNLLNGGVLALKSGDGGSGNGGGAGGAAEVIINGNFNAQGGLLDFYKGQAGSGGAAGGALKVEVRETLDIAADKKLTMNITGDPLVAGTDLVFFNTIQFNPGSSFITAAVASIDYSNSNLRVVTGTNLWDSGANSVYAPDNIGANRNIVFFDQSDIGPDQLMLNMNGVQANLENFDPARQQEAWLTDPNSRRPGYSDDPGHDPGQNEAIQPFLTSIYQTKRLHLGRVTLLSLTDGSKLTDIANNPAIPTWLDGAGAVHYLAVSALGDDYGDFAYTAGLRRYYWDVYSSAAPGNPLMAHNYFTADATRVLAQGALGGLAVAAQSFMQGAEPALAQAALAPAGEVSVAALISGGRVRQDTGSHVDVKGVFGSLTASRTDDTAAGKTTWGAFLEFGRGNYDTESFIYRYGEVLGEGRANALGGGLFFSNSFEDGPTLAASLRAGGLRNRYNVSEDRWIRHPEVHAYRTSSFYMGAHLGLSRSFQMDETIALEPYLKTFWTRVGADSFITDFGDQVELEAINSVRSRLGARALFNAGREEPLSGYLGLAWEHEYGAKAEGLYAGDPIADPPTLKGASLFGEAGLNFKADDNVNFNLGAFGLAGRQKGAGGQLTMRVDF